MSELLTKETQRPDSLAGLWNEKVQLGAQIEDLLKPFREKYLLRADQVEVVCGFSGVHVKVTL